MMLQIFRILAYFPPGKAYGKGKGKGDRVSLERSEERVHHWAVVCSPPHSTDDDDGAMRFECPRGTFFR